MSGTPPPDDTEALRRRLIRDHFREIVSAYRDVTGGDRAVVVVLGERDDDFAAQVLGYLFVQRNATPGLASPLSIRVRWTVDGRRYFIGVAAAVDFASAVFAVRPNSQAPRRLRTAPLNALNIVCIAARGLTLVRGLPLGSGWELG